MSSNSTDTTTSCKTFGLRFRRLALVAFIITASLIVSWIVWPGSIETTALSSVEGSDNPIVQKTQVALLKSQYVLKSALQQPGIASLLIVQSQNDPLRWLQQDLNGEFRQNTENLTISLCGSKAHANDQVKIVDAVAQAYLKAQLPDRVRQIRKAANEQ